MTDNQTQNNKKDKYNVSLPFFGIPRLLKFLKPYRKLFFFMVFFGLCGSTVDIVMPIFQSYSLNHFVGEKLTDTMMWFILLYIFALVFASVSNFTSTYLANCVEMRTGRDLRAACFHHLQTLSFSYFNQNSVGYIHARVMSDTARIGTLVSWSLMDGIWHLSYILGAAGVMLVINWKLALLVLTVIPLLALVVAVFQKKLTVINRKIREINSTITGDFNEGIVGAKTIKTLVAEEKIEENFKKDTAEMHKTATHAARYRAIFGSSISFAGSLALAIVLWKGGNLTKERLLDIGMLNMFISYAMGIMEPVRWFIDCISDLITTQVNIERVTNLIATKSDVTDSDEVIEKYGTPFSPKYENWEDLHGDVEFRDVSFKYPDGDEYIFEHFDLKIPQGTNVAIVGETGAGKSTLVNLVCRFFEATSGKILIDGVDVKERSQLWLHSHIGYVLQTPHLFSGTVLENMRYGKPDATEEEVYEALKIVSADDVIEKMDNGLQSEVGEGGDLLSTGEKQLLSFARAILTDPKILILDEATASIDTITEKKIQDAIYKITEGRTSFVIAHRLSTIRNADIILVVNNGKITERGTHSELMAIKGEYYNLYTRQFEKEAAEQVLS